MTKKTNDNQDQKKIYLLSIGQKGHFGADCNPVVCVTTSLFKLRKAVEFCIHAGTLTYGNSGTPIPEQIRALRDDWKSLTRCELNQKLRGGYLRAEENGAII